MIGVEEIITSDYRLLVEFSRDENLDYQVIVSGYDSYSTIPRLKTKKIESFEHAYHMRQLMIETINRRYAS